MVRSLPHGAGFEQGFFFTILWGYNSTVTHFAVLQCLNLKPSVFLSRRLFSFSGMTSKSQPWSPSDCLEGFGTVRAWLGTVSPALLCISLFPPLYSLCHLPSACWYVPICAEHFISVFSWDQIKKDGSYSRCSISHSHTSVFTFTWPLPH